MPNGGPYAKVTRELLYEKYDGKLGRDLIQLMSFSSDRIDSIDYIWDEFNNVFSKTGNLLDNPVFYKDYYTEAFKKLVDDNVEYLELRSGFGKFNGHNDDYFLNLLIGAEADAMTYAAQKDKKFKLRIILSGNRGKSRKFDTVQKMLKAARWALDNRYSDYIIGFDLVSEEDRGCNTEMFAQFIISSQIYKILNFYFHDGETSWQFNTNMIDAYMLSDRRVGHGFGLHSFPNLTDNLSYEQNTPTHRNLVMNAAINAANNGNLGAYFTFWENTLNDIKADNTLETDEKKFTYLLELIRPPKNDDGDDDKKKPNMPDIELPDFPETGTAKIPGKDIGRACALALEICPISNQMLRYTPDLRLHPAITLLHRGVQCVLANDDPQIFGNTGLTYDFISAFYAWDFDLWQIKQLIVNSLVYSAIPRNNNITEADPYDDILMALNRFNVLWHLFLFEEVPDLPSDEMLNEIALPGHGVHGGGHVGLVKDPAYNLNYSATSIDNLYLNYLDI